MDASCRFEEVEKEQCDEEFVEEVRISRVKWEGLILTQISQLENQVEKFEIEKLQQENELNELKKKINFSSLSPELEKEYQSLRMLETKIDYIKKKILNSNEVKNENLENQINSDSIYLQTLQAERKKKTELMREKIKPLKPIENLQNKLQKLYEDMAEIQTKLQMLKQTKFGNSKTNYLEIYEALQKKLEQLQNKNEKRKEMEEQIKMANRQLRKQNSDNLTLQCKLKLINVIYSHYENQCEQQKTMISNLSEEKNQLTRKEL